MKQSSKLNVLNSISPGAYSDGPTSERCPVKENTSIPSLKGFTVIDCWSICGKKFLKAPVEIQVKGFEWSNVKEHLPTNKQTNKQFSKGGMKPLKFHLEKDPSSNWAEAPSATSCSLPSSSWNLKGRPLMPQVAEAKSATARSAELENFFKRCSSFRWVKDGEGWWRPKMNDVNVIHLYKLIYKTRWFLY